MGFNVTGGNRQESDRPQVDWKAMNEAVVKAADLEQPETLVGILSGVIDLGVQPQNPAEYLFDPKDGTEEEQLAASKVPDTRFEDRAKFFNDGTWCENVRVKVVPRKDVQCIALTVDFPDIIVDKGVFFGNSNPQPLRMLIGGEFKASKESPLVVAKPFPLTVRKNDKTNNEWSMPFNSTLHKMAVAAKLVEKGKPFLPQDVDKLLGKAFQFEAQVGFNDKGYYFEKVAFKAAVGRGQVIPEFDPSILYMIQFSEQNEESAVKQLRASVKNTIKRATNYTGSVIQTQLEDSAPASTPQEPAHMKEQVPDDAVGGGFDDSDESFPF